MPIACENRAGPRSPEGLSCVVFDEQTPLDAVLSSISL